MRDSFFVRVLSQNAYHAKFNFQLKSAQLLIFMKSRRNLRWLTSVTINANWTRQNKANGKMAKARWSRQKQIKQGKRKLRNGKSKFGFVAKKTRAAQNPYSASSRFKLEGLNIKRARHFLEVEKISCRLTGDSFFRDETNLLLLCIICFCRDQFAFGEINLLLPWPISFCRDQFAFAISELAFALFNLLLPWSFCFCLFAICLCLVWFVFVVTLVGDRRN